MNHSAGFGRRQPARHLLDYSKSKVQGKSPISSDALFERFPMDKLHRIKAFGILLSVMDDPGDILMLDLRSGLRFADKSRASGWVLGEFSPDYLKRDRRV
jgi:hypothetical protein